MRAMLLTAGLGERMRPLTDEVPKPALPVLGRPIVVQLLRWLAQLEPEHVVLNLHHRPEALRELLGDGGSGGLPRLRYSHEPAILGTAGGLRRAAPLLRGRGPIVVSNSDFLSDIDLHAVVGQHRESGHLATLVLAPRVPGYSRVDVDAEGRVVSLAGTPGVDADRIAASFLFTGCHVLAEDVLTRIPHDGPSDIVRDVYRALAAEGRLGAYVHQGFWREFGTPELYFAGSMALLAESHRRRVRVTEHDPVRVLDGAVVALGAGARCDATARLLGRVALGFASQVAAGAWIEDSIVMPEAWIGVNARIRRAIVAPGAELPKEFQAEDALVCPGETPLVLPLGAGSAS